MNTLIQWGISRVRPGPILPCGHHYYPLNKLRSLRGIMPERDDGEHKFMSENG